MDLAASVVRTVADFALPPRCPACGTITGANHRFCGDCWQQLRFLAPPWCGSCCAPFEFDRGDTAQCAACIADPPRHDGVFAPVAYGDIARTLALRLKYGGRMAYADTVARQMRRVMPDEVDLLIPVPLHRWRIWRRGFNQAALIADALGQHAGVAVDRHRLRRTRATPALRGMGGQARRKAVRGAFGLAAGAKPALRDRTVGLVDDVYTSGATTDACLRLLKRAGARKVMILTWARVLNGED